MNYLALLLLFLVLLWAVRKWVQVTRAMCVLCLANKAPRIGQMYLVNDWHKCVWVGRPWEYGEEGEFKGRMVRYVYLEKDGFLWRKFHKAAHSPNFRMSNWWWLFKK